jgi:MFS family permease
LRYSRFRWLLSGLAVSQTGDWLYNLALVVLVYERTHSALRAGVATAARVVPVVVPGPLGGVLADRFDRRRIMITCDLARMGLMVLLAAVAAFRLPIVLAPVIAAAATAGAAPYVSCVAAVTPRLVDDADLPGANAAHSAVTGAGIVLGPTLGGVLLLLGSAASAFALNALTFGLSALAVLAIRDDADPSPFRVRRAAERPDGLLREVAQGAAALRGHPAALRLVGADIMCSVLYGAQTVLLLLTETTLQRELDEDVFGRAYGLAFPAAIAGIVVGSVIAPGPAAQPAPFRLRGQP